MKLEVVRKIACEKFGLVPFAPRNRVQGFRLQKLYHLLVVLRVLLTLHLQTGWIHQDEFTNSLEVISGDCLDLQVIKSSAFNSSASPTRSIVFLHLTIQLPYILMYRLSSYLGSTGTDNLPNSTMLIVIPRIIQVLLSFLVDYILLQFCALQLKHRLNSKVSSAATDDNDFLTSVQYHSPRLLTLASSQILLVFTTRTSPALINLILFAALLLLVSDSIFNMDDYLPVLTKFHAVDPKQNVRERVRLLKLLKTYRYNPIENLHWIGLIVTAGVFNDPDFFLSYGSVPVFFYLQRGINHAHIGIRHFHYRLFTFIFYFFMFSIPFVLWDSFYHAKVSLTDFSTLQLDLSSFVVTPLNYFVTKATSWRELELMPWTLGSFLLQFNFLGLLALISISKELYDLAFNPWSRKPRLDSQWMFLNASWFIPLILLLQYKSMFDLVPLIFPLVVLHGHKISLISKYSWKLGLVWFLSNLCGLIFWGYLNQGGILSSFLEINSQMRPYRLNSQIHMDVVIAQMSAIPPTFVLGIPRIWKAIIPLNHEGQSSSISADSVATILKIEQDPQIRVFHLGVSVLPLCHFENEMLRILQKRSLSSTKTNLVLVPMSINRDSDFSCFRKSRLSDVKAYWNHFHFDWSGNEDSVKNSQVTRYFPKFRHGLQLYQFHNLREPYNDSLPRLLSFKSAPFLTYVTDCGAFLFTSFLFFTSFLTLAV